MGRMIRYRDWKQYTRYYTRRLHEQQKRKSAMKIPVSRVPDILFNKYGIEVVDPLSPNFPRPNESNVRSVNHPAIKQEISEEEHPLYKSRPCLLHNGTKPLAEGLRQALNLIKGVHREGVPEHLLKNVGNLNVAGMKEDMIRFIMQSQAWDPTMDPLPKRRDEVLWWRKWPRYYGIPLLRKNELLIDNMYRHTLSLAGKFAGLHKTAHFKDGQINALTERNEDLLQVVCKPRLTIASSEPLQRLEDDTSVAKTNQEPIVDIYPICPKIDLEKIHIYDDTQTYPLIWSERDLVPRTIMLSKDVNLAYPWTPTENVANAIMAAFGLAVSYAQKKYASLGNKYLDTLLPEPVTVQCVQVSGGLFDFVILQLNTLDLKNDQGVKNIVWIDKNNRFFSTPPYYETFTKVDDYDENVLRKFLALTLNCT